MQYRDLYALFRREPEAKRYFDTLPVHVQDLNGSSKYIGASAVKGRKVYAFKVTKPQTILIKKKA